MSGRPAFYHSGVGASASPRRLFYVAGTISWPIWRSIGILPLLGEPTMFFDPLFGFLFGIKFAEAPSGTSSW